MNVDVPPSNLIPPPTVVNDTHKRYNIAIACIFLGALTSCFVASRLVARFFSKTWGPDDWAVIPAVILYIGWTSLSGYINLTAGVDKPLEEITVPEFSLWYKGIIVTTWLYPIMSAAIRTSILLFYSRIFAGPLKVARYIIWTLLVLQAVYLIVFCILPAFICTELHYFWDVFHHLEHCNNWYYFWTQIGLYSVSMSFDWILFFFPIYPIIRLKSPLKKRIGVLFIFMCGAGASIAAAYKLAIFDIEMNRYVPTNPKWLTYEMSQYVPGQFDTYGYTFWIPSQIEPTVALIGTSLPALWSSFSSVSERASKFFQSHVTSKMSKSTWSESVRAPSKQFAREDTSEVELWDAETSSSKTRGADNKC